MSSSRSNPYLVNMKDFGMNTGVCDECGEEGHRSQQCPHMKCAYCGVKGHAKEQCEVRKHKLDHNSGTHSKEMME